MTVLVIDRVLHKQVDKVLVVKIVKKKKMSLQKPFVDLTSAIAAILKAEAKQDYLPDVIDMDLTIQQKQDTTSSFVVFTLQNDTCYKN